MSLLEQIERALRDNSKAQSQLKERLRSEMFTEEAVEARIRDIETEVQDLEWELDALRDRLEDFRSGKIKPQDEAALRAELEGLKSEERRMRRYIKDTEEAA